MNTNTVEELLAWADPRKPLGRLRGIEDLEEELIEPAWLSEVEADLNILELIAHTEVSPKIRAICLNEMATGQRNGWNI
jgi:hypothetical protein